MFKNGHDGQKKYKHPKSMMSAYSNFLMAIGTPEQDAAARLEHNRQLLSELRYNNLQNIFVSGIFAFFFSQQSASQTVWVWWAAFVLLVLIRALVVRWISGKDDLDESQQTAAIYICIGTTALAWGFAPLACPPAGDLMLFILAISWVAIVVIGGASAFQDDPVATSVLAVPATAPALFVLISNNDQESLAIIIAICLIYAHLIVGIVRARRMRNIELQLKTENAQLMREYQEQARLASEEIERRLHIERELRAARHRAERLSSLDGLTGIANRRHFDEHMDAELLRAFRGRKQLSVVLLDIDCFKAFNDTFGHAAGDDCLKEIAEILAGYARRSGDLAARYGGEEFVLLLPETESDAALQIAESMRADLTKRNIQHHASDVAPYVTASFGVATLVPNAELTARGLIEAADRALYQAKNSGRDRVVAAT